jgi:hypothetical protein
VNDPSSLTDQGTALARMLAGHDNLEQLIAAKLGIEPAEDPDAPPVDADGNPIRDRAVDPFQGSGNSVTHRPVDDLEQQLRYALGGF